MKRWFARLKFLLPALALGVAAVAVNQWALDHPKRWDLTSAGVYSIGPQTRRVLDELQQPVAVTFFYDLRSKEMNDARALLEQYAAQNRAFTVRSFDPALAPAEARRQQVQFAGTAVFESNGRRVVVNGGSEADFTNGLIRVTVTGDQRVCFTDGHVEADPQSLKSHDHFEGDMGSGHSHSSGGRQLVVHERHGMGMARDALQTLGYGVRVVSLVAGPNALAGCTVVVIAGPQQAFVAAEVAQLQAYAAAGGRLIALVDPFVDSGLAPLFADFGLKLEPRLVLDDQSHYWTDPATPAVSTYPRHKITRNLPLTFFPGAASLVPLPGKRNGEVRLTPLVQTGDAARSEPIPPATGKPDTGLQTLAVLASKKLDAADKRAELVLVGDVDFGTNSFFHVLGNGALFLNAVSYLADQQRLIDITPRQYELPRVQLTNGQMRATFILSTVLLPLTALALSVFVWWRRRR
jgi:ABC-type uncharacterized transport system involved in gliding motility auxiliary subunit